MRRSSVAAQQRTRSSLRDEGPTTEGDRSAMTSTDLLTDAFERIREAVYQVVDGLTPEQRGYRIDKGANSIAWLVWHLTRIQDDHVAGVAGADQVWTSAGWRGRCGRA